VSIRILLADDHRIVRDGLRSLIESHTGLEVIGEADDGHEAVRLAWKLKPDVVLMDVAMPDLNGMDATRRILEDTPKVRVLGLSMHADRRFVGEMLRAGASGYLLKDSAFEEVFTAITTVASGRTYLGPGITDLVVDDYVRQMVKGEESKGEAGVAAALTGREREVLQLLAEGRTTREVAGLLGVSAKTIETHRRTIMQRLSIYSMAGLVKYAVREGLTTLEA
jgi:two-component system, NarL family, response regulator NreC